MYIERAEIFGFKSFAHKTELVLGPGLCVVMGPNGVGKSNIFDGIRWAIGEQRLSLLRSSALEDVIFKGSAGMRPLNFAEVSVQIAEAEGLVHYDPKADRIKITRRAFREGDSQFFINGVPVRLKDIRGILATVGLGDAGYAVIEQRMIRRIIEGSTEDRRVLFEQAAGIAKYKTDKAATQTKLRATQEDLVRLEDILREVEEQEAILRRQVRRARRYKSLLEKVKEIEKAIISGRLAKLEFDRKENNDKLKDAELNLQRHTAEVVKVQAQVQKVIAQRNEIETKRDALAQNHRQISSEISGLEQEIAVLDERVKNAENILVDSARQRDDFTDSIKHAESEKTKAEEALKLNSDRQQRVEDEIKQIELELTKLDKKILIANCEKSEYDRHSEVLRNKRAQTENRLAFGKAELKKFYQRRDELEKNSNQRNAALESLRKQLDSIVVNLETVSNKSGQKEKSLAFVKEQRSELNLKLAQLNSEISEKKQKQSNLVGRIEELEGIIARGEDIGKGAQILASKLDEFGLTGALANLLHIPSEYSAVAERALGDKVNYLVAETVEQALKAVENLPQDAGEVGFIILSELKKPKNVPAWFSADDPRLGALIANIEVGDNFSESPAGILISPDGRLKRISGEISIITGESSVGALTIRNQLQEMKERVEFFKEQISRLEAEGEQLREKNIGNESNIAEIEKELMQIHDELSRSSREQTKIQAQLENFEKGIEELNQSFNNLDLQIETRNRELAVWQDELTKVVEAITNHDSIIEKAERGIEGFGKARRKIDGQIAAKQVEQVGIEGEIRNARNEIQRSEIAISDTLRKLEELERAVNEAQKTIEDSRSKVSSLKKDIQQKFSELEKLEKQQDKVREELDLLDGVLIKKRREEQDLSQQRDEAQHDISEIKSNLSAIQASLKQIRMQAQEDFGEIPSPGKPLSDKAEAELHTKLANTKRKLELSGAVNLEAEEQYEMVKKRLDFLNEQRTDITESITNLKSTINRLDAEAKRLFMETFESAKVKFKEVFCELFEDGDAELELETPDEPITSEILIKVKPAGKRILTLSQLSDGEKALTALALLFGLYLVKPSPFCLMDEIDAPLDDVNVDRFLMLVRRFSKDIQFIIVSHNKRTLERADYLYGVSMERDGVSRVVSIKMSDLKLDLE